MKAKQSTTQPVKKANKNVVFEIKPPVNNPET